MTAFLYLLFGVFISICLSILIFSFFYFSDLKTDSKYKKQRDKALKKQKTFNGILPPPPPPPIPNKRATL